MSARHVLTILAVSDLERSKRFYAEAFGWPLGVDAPVYAEHELPGGMRLGLYERNGFAHNTGQLPEEMPSGALSPTELYFHVDDPRASAPRLRVRAKPTWSMLPP